MENRFAISFRRSFLDGLVIVVSPLIALMKDQVDILIDKGIAAVYINSTLSLLVNRDFLRETSSIARGVSYQSKPLRMHRILGDNH